MLIPVGDDLKKRSLPFVGITLIAANVLVGMYEHRLWHDGQPKHKDHFSKMVDSWKTEDPWDDDYSFAAHEPAKPVIPPDFREFITTWGLVPREVPEGRWDRLITYQFLHADIWHFVGNVLTLWVFLGSLEAGLGGFQFLCLYLMSGIVGGLAHWYMLPESNIPMIGASGAISGVIGAYFVAFGALANLKMLWNGGFLTGWKFIPFSVPAGVYVFFWIIIPQAFAVENALNGGDHEGVAWFAHAGGFAFGALFMLCFRGDVLSRLRHNKEGELELTDEPAVEKPVAQRETLAEAICAYCKTPLGAGMEMTPELIKCGNPTCGRLNIVNAHVSDRARDEAAASV